MRVRAVFRLTAWPSALAGARGKRMLVCRWWRRLWLRCSAGGASCEGCALLKQRSHSSRHRPP